MNDFHRHLRADEAEEALIGSLFVEPGRLREVTRIVKPSHFMDALFRALFAAMLAIHGQGKLVEPIAVLERVRSCKDIPLSGDAVTRIAESALFLEEIRPPTAVHAVHYAGLVAGAGIRRELAVLGEQAHHGDEETIQRMVALSSELAAVENATKPFTTLQAECSEYLRRLTVGKSNLVKLGIDSVDDAIGGGVAFGEMVVVAARPSNGKTLAAVQFVENLAAQGFPGLIISEEMTASLIAERSIGHVTTKHRDDWRSYAEQIESDVQVYFGKDRAPVYIAESCGTVQVALRTIDRAASEGVRVVAVDYAQLLRGKGSTQYERVTNVSNEMKKVAKRNEIVLLLLCQLSRPDKTRKVWRDDGHEQPRGVIPVKSDLRDSGYIEQDADVILFLQWPLADNSKYKPYDEYFIYVGKNRNRHTNAQEVCCRIIPSRQLIEDRGTPRHGDAEYREPYSQLEVY